jgi:hypothetical protein
VEEAVLLDNDDPPVIVDEQGSGEPQRHWRGDLLLLLGYVAASLVFWHEALPHLATQTLGGATLDPGLFVWFLNWTPYAIVHGLDPFRTTFIDAPIGVSAMWNTSVLALGVLFAPVTLAFGPIASFNLACILGPPLSAWTASFWLRRYVSRLPAALGGLLFGFSPFVIAQSRAGHLMFTWLVLVPVILMLAEDLLWRAPRPIWPQAPLLGLVIAVQILISSETLLIVTMLCVGVALALAAGHPRAARERLPTLVPAAAVTLGVALALAAWPLIEAFGTRHEIRQPVQRLGALGGSAAMVVAPGRSLLLHVGRGPRAHLNVVENGLYIGVPLLLVLIAATVLLRKRPGVLIAAATIGIAIALQMHGTHWHAGGTSIRSPLGFLQDRVALTRDILPGRFAIAMWIAVAWLFAVALDQVLRRATGKWRVTAVVAAVACLVALLPANQEPVRAPEPIPPLFTTSLRDTIPQGSTVMLAPMAAVGYNAAQLWQIKAKMRFRQVGGYALHAIGRDASPSYYPYPKTLTRLFMIKYATGQPYRERVTPAQLATARRELRATGASLFLVAPSPTGTRTHLRLAEDLLGRPPDRRVGGVAIWDLPGR